MVFHVGGFLEDIDPAAAFTAPGQLPRSTLIRSGSNPDM